MAWLGGVQAQDYGAAKWAVGLRLPEGATDSSIEEALTAGAILRTHALRGTWQLVSPADIRWMLALVSPRVIARFATRHRQLELDEATFRRSNTAIERSLRQGHDLTREEIAAVLNRTRISTVGQRLAHLIARAELDGVICSGPRRGKKGTYALVDQRAPTSPRALSRDEALAELARRYFRSRGPATIADFTWWSGLPPSDARAGLESVRAGLVSDVVDGRTYWASDEPARRSRSPAAYLLPAFDEYLVAYRHRDAVLDPTHVKHLNAGGGLLGPCVVVDGRVIGTWRRSLERSTVTVELNLFDKPRRTLGSAVSAAAVRYAAFLGPEARIATVLSEVPRQ
ncbi:MAG TPA: winged helix DNA-binding domain-containing protein [Myxococcaceae bacterium]|nr:winged helix DNA-binding domain-containing protein [Myxococcaceae bacterium]